MIRTILDKIMIYGSDEDKETISNILSLKLTDFKENQEQLDIDSGLAHAAHMAWNALARLELMLRKD